MYQNFFPVLFFKIRPQAEHIIPSIDIVSFLFNVKRPHHFAYNVRLKTCLAPHPLKILIYREGIQLLMHLIPAVPDVITVI